MRVLVGTSGYSYKEWKGSFYPEKIKPDEMLPFYAERLDTVEINNTFYRMPKRTVVQSWAEAVPETFSFVLKASMRITHKKRLKDADEDVFYMTRSAKELGDKLGPTLFQLPPYLKKDAERLAAFLKVLPEGWQSAFEFRNASWFDDEIYGILKEGGAALVASDSDGAEEPPVVATAPYGYFRLRRERYTEEALDGWAKKIRTEPWETVHVFFKHEEGAGPALASEFRGRF